MKTLKLSSLVSIFIGIVLLVAVGASSARAQESNPQDVSGGGGPGLMIPLFTYQGQLKNSASPVNGACDFKFSLWDMDSGGGVQIGVDDEQPAIPVTNGIFTVLLNTNAQFNPLNNSAFQGDRRWLETSVRCPAGSGSYTTLAPRQPISAVPYALTLAPGPSGSRVTGSAYQVLKVVNNTTASGIPAAVTGEMTASLDGVGVYGSNTNNATSSTGIGVWGRSYSVAGMGVRANGYNGSVGVYAEASGGGAGLYAKSNGVNVFHPALFAENTNTATSEPAGVAIFGLNHGGDTAIVAQNTGTGDVYRAISANGQTVTFRVDNSGHVSAPSATLNGGSDLAEQFAVSGAAPEAGTLMVLDADHPGQLKPSSAAYDPKVAGVVSGAGGLEPGLTLAEESGAPIAIGGRVYVNAEALSTPIHVGDLLTSSDLAGYAMKAADPARTQGTVIGKAMSNLESGTGLVLVLVNLQ